MDETPDPRHHDIYDVPLSFVPVGSAYQWVSEEARAEREANGWSAVPIDRHPEVFRGAQSSSPDRWTFNELTLMEKAASATEAFRAATIAKADALARKSIGDVFKDIGGKMPDGAVMFEVNNRTIEPIPAPAPLPVATSASITRMPKAARAGKKGK